MSLSPRPLPAIGSPLLRVDSGAGADWLYMHTQTPQGYHPCFSERLLHEIKRSQEAVRNRVAANPDPQAGVHHLVLASDAPANPPGAALVAERESDTFDVDNSPPSIAVASVTRDNGRTTVRFTVKDADSPVQRVEYSIEADRWRPIYPKDGIADSRSEEFELVLDQDVGDRQIILRAFDTMNNVATTRAEAQARR